MFNNGLIIIKDNIVKRNSKLIQFLQVKSPYGAWRAIKSRLKLEEYAILIGSIAKVKGLNDASQPNQDGINDIGARAVLANRRGKLTTKIRAISSIWPGRIKAKHKLIEVTNKTNKIKVAKTIPNPKKLGNP